MKVINVIGLILASSIIAIGLAIYSENSYQTEMKNQININKNLSYSKASFRDENLFLSETLEQYLAYLNKRDINISQDKNYPIFKEIFTDRTVDISVENIQYVRKNKINRGGLSYFGLINALNEYYGYCDNYIFERKSKNITDVQFFYNLTPLEYKKQSHRYAIKMLCKDLQPKTIDITSQKALDKYLKKDPIINEYLVNNYLYDENILSQIGFGGSTYEDVTQTTSKIPKKYWINSEPDGWVNNSVSSP